MKKLNFFWMMMVALVMATSFTACKDDDDDPVNPDPGPEVPVEEETPYHFDLTVTVGRQGGMGRDVTTIMQSVAALDGGPMIDFRNKGAEINADYSMEAIVKGKYYYQVPVSADRFTKFQFVDNQVKVVQEQKFVGNTYITRQYTHSWINDSTLVIMAATGDKTGVQWTKLNANTMAIIAEGKLNISVEEGWETLTTSGVLAFRESDNTLFYFYYNKKGKGRTATNEPHFHVVAIDAASMNVIQNVVNSEATEMAGSAYGELLQNTVFFDEDDNLYLAAFNDTEAGEMGCLLRISKGKYNFDAGYNGFPNSDGKLLTVQYLGNGKVFTYSRDDSVTEDDGKGGTKAATGIDSYSHYYSVVDLKANTRTRMAFNGSAIPFSSGRFSQRSAFVKKENKVYFGVNTESANPCVYIYDVATGTVAKGVEIAEGYYFEQIRVLEEDKK